MKTTRIFLTAAMAAGLLFLSGCATKLPPFDYTAFDKARPATLLVLPPLNESPSVEASAGVWAQATAPLAEAGYYVLPVTLVDETFRQQGVHTPTDAHGIAITKLREFFGADAVVYIKVRQYGTTYSVISSQTTVEVESRIVDLRSDTELWRGRASASSAENQQSQNNLTSILIAAVLQQVVGTLTDASYKFAGLADQRMLDPKAPNGILVGPRSAEYGKR